MLESIGCPAYKLASLDYGKTELRDAVIATGKLLIESMPFPKAVAGTDSLKLFCPSGYPQKEINLGNIRNGYDGFSYHGTDGTVLAFAVAHGAKLIEAHMQLDDVPSELESNISLTASQYATVVRGARRIEYVA